MRQKIDIYNLENIKDAIKGYIESLKKHNGLLSLSESA